MCCNQLVHGAKGLAKAMLEIEFAGSLVMKSRRDICRSCEFAAHNKKAKFASSGGLTNFSRCKKCSCIIAAKTKVASEKCPMGKWGAVPAEQMKLPWAPMLHPGEHAVVTGCDEGHEKYLKLWYRSYISHNSYRIHFCDFGISPEALAYVKTWQNVEIIDCKDVRWMHPWYRKAQGCLRATTEHLLWVDTDCVFSNYIWSAFGHDEKVYVIDDHPATRTLYPDMIQAGVIGFRHGDWLIQKWAEQCYIGDEIANKIEPWLSLRDQTILSHLLKEHPEKRGRLDPSCNWTPMVLGKKGDEWTSEPRPPVSHLCITHYCADHGKLAMDRMNACVVTEEVEQKRLAICASCSLSRKNQCRDLGKTGVFNLATAQCIATGKLIAGFSYMAQASCPALKWDKEEIPMLDWRYEKPQGKGIITGCDARQGWLIPIFVHYLRKTGCNLPITFVDFGMDDKAKELAKQHGTLLDRDDHVVDMWKKSLHPMWQKIICLLSTPYEWTAWLDMDITFFINPEVMFDIGPCTLSAREGCKYYLKLHSADNIHTGAIVYKHGDAKVRLWASMSALAQNALVTIPDPDNIRDEELFSALCREHNWYDQFHHMKPEYCSLGDEPFTRNRNIHHTGPEGKKRIWEWAKADGLVTGDLPWENARKV